MHTLFFFFIKSKSSKPFKYKRDQMCCILEKGSKVLVCQIGYVISGPAGIDSGSVNERTAASSLIDAAEASMTD